jgi:hypothetical protein
MFQSISKINFNSKQTKSGIIYLSNQESSVYKYIGFYLKNLYHNFLVFNSSQINFSALVIFFLKFLAAIFIVSGINQAIFSLLLIMQPLSLRLKGKNSR